ncbi:PRC-barrel domain-containing protein [Hoeflea sp. YIM 152468]|uniref:PRC-barrel domain-containing protein n=1 Tax=Hoeflea sp. YIM 152468 TaxID=3031759 RepID=UPI0023DB7168|nr:PRC-barrel domain-containing protein [Hoeflea sp. YIM 152468]MDF1606925.1 PRC-barrel domain-containing protein [Hoeflea sp. YIM 152468]
MFKMLLASTALATLVTTSALAASHSQTPAATSETVVTTDQGAAMDTNMNLASRLIGSSVYASASEDAEKIGDINDIVIHDDGQISSIVVGVGGFLGIGEKDVSVDYDTIEWVERDGDRWLVANMSREQLEAAQPFDRTTIYPDRGAAVDMTATPDAEQPTGMATDTDKPAEEMTAEKIENGTSAVAPAEQQTTSIDRSTMTVFSAEELTADNLIGRTVYSANDENIGEVGDVLLTSDNKVEGFILDVGGFLGMGEKQVAVSPENLDIRADANGDLTLFTPFTEDQLEAQPEYSEDSWKTDRDGVILRAPAR